MTDSVSNSNEAMERAANTVRFVIPNLPPSTNGLLYPDWRNREMRMYDSVRRWKSNAKGYVLPFRIGKTSLVRVDVIAHYPFFHANGKFKIIDTHNCLKVTIDAVAEACGWNDARAKSGSWDSVDSSKEQVIITLTEYPMVRRQV